MGSIFCIVLVLCGVIYQYGVFSYDCGPPEETDQLYFAPDCNPGCYSGYIAMANCKPGFVEDSGDVKTMKCLEGGTWQNNINLQCRAGRSCDTSALSGGYLIPGTLSHEEIGKFECYKGFKRPTKGIDSDFDEVICLDGSLVYNDYKEKDYIENWGRLFLRDKPADVCDPVPTSLSCKWFNTFYEDEEGEQHKYCYDIPQNTTIKIICAGPEYQLPEPLRSAKQFNVMTYQGKWLIDADGDESVVDKQPVCEEKPEPKEKPCFLQLDANTDYFYTDRTMIASAVKVPSGTTIMAVCKDYTHVLISWGDLKSESRNTCHDGNFREDLKCKPKSCKLPLDDNTIYSVQNEDRVLPHGAVVEASCVGENSSLGNGQNDITMYCQYGELRIENNTASLTVEHAACVPNINCYTVKYNDNIQYYTERYFSKELVNIHRYYGQYTNGPYEQNTTISYKCGPYRGEEDRFSVDSQLAEGLTHITCDKDQGWMPKPYCPSSSGYCRLPYAKDHHQFKKYTQYSYQWIMFLPGDTVKAICEVGFTEESGDVKVIKCLQDATWNATVDLKCREIKQCLSDDFLGGKLDIHDTKGTFSCDEDHYYEHNHNKVVCVDGTLFYDDCYDVPYWRKDDCNNERYAQCIPKRTEMYDKNGPCWSDNTVYTDDTGTRITCYSQPVPHNTTINIQCEVHQYGDASFEPYQLPEPYRSAREFKVVAHFGKWLVDVDGKQTILDELPRCEEKPCELKLDPNTIYSHFDNGNVVTTDIIVEPGSSVIGTCVSGYEFESRRSGRRLTCRKAQLGRTTCQPTSCKLHRNKNTAYNIPVDDTTYVPHNHKVEVSCIGTNYHLGKMITSMTIYCEYGDFRMENNTNSPIVEETQCFSTVNCSVRYFNDKVKYIQKDGNYWGDQFWRVIGPYDSAEFAQDEVIKYSCPIKSDEIHSITCNGQQGWIPKPVCNKDINYCRITDEAENGNIYFTWDSYSRGVVAIKSNGGLHYGLFKFPPGTILSATCKNGYTKVSGEVLSIACLSSGTWDTQVDLNCQAHEATCGSVDVRGGYLLPATIPDGAKGRLECYKEYQLPDETILQGGEVKCENRRLVFMHAPDLDVQCNPGPTRPDCSIRHTDYIDSKGHAYYDCQPIPHNTRITLKCKDVLFDHYQLPEPYRSADEFWVKTLFGKWLINVNGEQMISDTAPVCEAKPCKFDPDFYDHSLFSFNNGSAVTAPVELETGTEIHVTCEPDYESLRIRLECLDGDWDRRDEPVCRPKSCSLPWNFNAKYVKTEGVGRARLWHSNSVQISCNEGYHNKYGGSDMTLYCIYGNLRKDSTMGPIITRSDAQCRPDCGANFTTVGNVSSLRHQKDGGGRYPGFLDCFWVITAPVGQTIQLSFDSFAVEYCDECSCDKVTIYDGSSTTDAMIATLCGEEVPDSINSSGNTLLVNMISDRYGSDNGITFSWDFL